MRPLKEKVSITLDADLVEIIRNMAEEDYRSFSQYINLILKRHIADTQKNTDTAQRPLGENE